jgi:bacterioferritin
MKGKPEVLEVLTGALTEEIGAAVQYIIHSEMCENWGYKKIGGITKERAMEEMKHAEKLIERILFLEGEPDLQMFPKIKPGRDVTSQFAIDLEGEHTAIVNYNQGYAACTKAGDQGSADLLLSNLRDEERHVDYLETQLGLIKELGLADYLARKLEE